MRVSRIAIAAPKLAPSIWIDTPRHPKLTFGDRAVQDAANLKRLEFNQMAVVSVLCFCGQPGDPRWPLKQDWEERRTVYFRHLFAYMK